MLQDRNPGRLCMVQEGLGFLLKHRGPTVISLYPCPVQAELSQVVSGLAGLLGHRKEFEPV